MITISVTQLSKQYHQTIRQSGVRAAFRSLFRPTVVTVDAVHDVSFSLEAGELVGFLGPNGAGKTTTLKILAGILYPDSGDVRILGFVPWERKNAFRRRTSIVMGQRNQLWWDLPVMETLILNRILYDIPERIFRQRLDHLTALLEVREFLNVQVRKLSLGQRMRCELIAALIHEPEVLFLDEPTIGLDLVSQQRIREFLREYVRRKETTVLLTSHNMEDIEELCQRVIVISRGSLIFDGSLNDLRARYAKTKSITATFSDRPNAARLTALGPYEDLRNGVVRFSVARDQAGAVARRLLDIGNVVDIAIEEEKVESVVRKIFAEKERVT